MLVDPMNQIHAVFTPIASLLYRYLDFNRAENNCMPDYGLRFILSPNPTKEKGAKSFPLCIVHWVNNSWDPGMKKSARSFSDFRKYARKCKRGSSPYFTGFFQPGFPCCPNFSNKDPLFTLTLGHWIRIQWFLGLSRQGLQVKTSFPYWAKTQRQNSIKHKEPSLSTWRKATPWVRREAGNGQLAFQPSSEGPSTPWAPVPAAIINWRAATVLSAALEGRLHLHPTKERTASLRHSLSRGIFLCLELQIQNCAENILGADPTQGNPLNSTDPVWFWHSLPLHCQAPRAVPGRSHWHGGEFWLWMATPSGTSHRSLPAPSRVTERTPFPCEADHPSVWEVTFVYWHTHMYMCKCVCEYIYIVCMCACESVCVDWMMEWLPCLLQNAYLREGPAQPA